MSGCGADYATIKPPSDKEVAGMKELRTIFDAHHGDETQFTAEEKQKFLDYEKGDQSKVDSLISWMKNPKGGGTNQQNRPFQTGPNGQIMPPGSNPGN